MSFLHLVRPLPLLGFIIAKLFTIKSSTNILDNQLGISISCLLGLSSLPSLFQLWNYEINSWCILLKLKCPTMQPSGRPRSSYLLSHGNESNTYGAHSFCSFPFLLYFIYSVTYLKWLLETNPFKWGKLLFWTIFSLLLNTLNEQFVGLNSVYYFYILSSLSESS